MKLSVIVPVYNLERYVSACIESLVSQQCDFEYEIIIADDCSTDGSKKVISEYQSCYPQRIKAIYQEKNIGLVENLRQLLSSANGEYIAYLDGDDLALPDKLQHQVAYMERHSNCSISYHESEVFDSDSGNFIKLYSKGFYNWSHIPNQAKADHLVEYGTFLQASAMMVRNYPGIENSVDKRCKIIVDYPFHILNAIALGGTIDFIDEILGRYRVHNDSFGAQTSRSVKRRLDVLQELLYCCDLAEARGLTPASCDIGRKHFYFAAAVYVMRMGKYEEFCSLIEQSTDGDVFFNEKHRFCWEHKHNFKRLSEELSVAVS